MMVSYRIAKENTRKILAAMDGDVPKTCAEIAAAVSLDHRHVRQIIKRMIARGEAFEVPNNFPARYTSTPGVVYVETKLEWEEKPFARIYRPAGTWEKSHARMQLRPTSVFSWRPA